MNETMCDCLNNVGDKLTEQMMADNPGWELKDRVSFTQIGYCLASQKTILVLPVLGKVIKGKQTRRFSPSIYPSYCPFCGEKLNLK